MYKYGGIYAYLDYECLKNIEPLLHQSQVVLGRADPPNWPHGIPNAFLASTARHPFWIHVLRDIMQNYGKHIWGVETVTGRKFIIARKVLFNFMSS